MNILDGILQKLLKNTPRLVSMSILIQSNKMCQIACGNFHFGQIVFGEMDFHFVFDVNIHFLRNKKKVRAAKSTKMIGRLSVIRASWLFLCLRVCMIRTK